MYFTKMMILREPIFRRDMALSRHLLKCKIFFLRHMSISMKILNHYTMKRYVHEKMDLQLAIQIKSWEKVNKLFVHILPQL